MKVWLKGSFLIAIGTILTLSLENTSGLASPSSEEIQAREQVQERAAMLRDQEERNYSYSRSDTPQLNALPVDTDNDGMPDTWETAFGLDPNDPADAWLDPDKDRVYNLFEYQLDCEPQSRDCPPIVTVGASGTDYTSVETALNNVADGTCIRVAAGTYPCTYSNYNARKIMIQGGWNNDFSNRDLTSYYTTLDGELKGDEILNFTNSHGSHAVYILDGIHFIRGSGFSGAVDFSASFLGSLSSIKTSIMDCSFTQCTSTDFEGIVCLIPHYPCTCDYTIANTLIAGNIGSGIYSQVTAGAQARCRILNSTITGNQDGGRNGCGYEAFTSDTSVFEIQIYNTITKGNTNADIEVRRSITVTSDYSDIAWVNADSGAVYYSGINDINVTPSFVGGGDYHLQATSECIDQGQAGLGPATDLDGLDRPNPDTGEVDIGCYEYYRIPTPPTPTPTPPPTPKPYDGHAVGDYDGNGATDIAIYRPSAGLWLVRGITRAYFGNSSDQPVPQDYDGDGTWDLAYFRPSNNLWKVKDLTRIYFATSSDTLIPQDYDGDYAADFAYFRPSNGLWNIRGITRLYFGRSDDQPVPGDYGGYGACLPAYYRPSNGLWNIKFLTRLYFGTSSDQPVPGDYNADGKTDCAYFRPSNGLWKVLGVTRLYFGTSTDTIIPGDYNGDGTCDFGYFKPSSILWKVKGVTRVYFGRSDDLQMSNPY